MIKYLYLGARKIYTFPAKYILCLSVCVSVRMFVCLLVIGERKKPIEQNIFEATHMTPGKEGLWLVEVKKKCPKKKLEFFFGK